MTFLLQLAALVIPGAVLFRLPWLDRERRAALDPEERAFWVVILAAAWSLSVVLVLAAAHRYSLTRLLIANGLFTAVAVALFRQRLRLSPPRRFSLSAALPLVLLVVCWPRFGPPSEYVLGGKDPGTYMNEGIQIAQRGSLVIADPVIAAVPPAARPLFFPQHRDLGGTLRTDYYGTRFMGFFIQDPDRGSVIGQFPHLFPASIAIAHGLNGLTGARYMTPLWAMLGVLAVYFTAARLFGKTTAFAAALLLALNVVEAWFAPYPNAEVVMQALLFAALLANARAHVDGDRFFAPVAGALIGLLLFLRFDAVLGVAGLAAGVVFGMFAGQRPRLSMIGTLALFFVPALYYFLVPMRAYATLPIVWISALPAWQLPAMAIVAAAVLFTVWAAASRPALREAVVSYVPILAIVAIGVLAVYALFLRHPGGKLTDYDAYALRTYANLYATLPAVIAALVGYALYARRSFWRDPALFFTAAIFSAFLFYKIRIVPDHFWAARRWVPIVLPMTMVFAAAAAIGPGGAGWRRAPRLLLGLVFLVLLGSHYVRVSRPVVEHVEYAGLIPKLEELAGRFADDDLVIVESGNAGGDMHTIAVPLAYIYARNVLVLNSPRPDKILFTAFLDWAKTRYRRVVFIGGGGTDLLSHRYGVRSIASERFQVAEYESARNAFPRTVKRKDFEFGLYEFTAAAPPAPGAWFDLDVGTRDDLHVLRLHAKEQSDGRSFRWTQDQSMVSVTTIQPDARTLTLELADGGRPAAAPPARIEVFLHNQQLGSVIVSGSFRPYAFAIPPELAARAAAVGDPVELRLLTQTWKPSEVLGSPDDRELGVMVDRVTIK